MRAAKVRANEASLARDGRELPTATNTYQAPAQLPAARTVTLRATAPDGRTAAINLRPVPRANSQPGRPALWQPCIVTSMPAPFRQLAFGSLPEAARVPHHFYTLAQRHTVDSRSPARDRGRPARFLSHLGDRDVLAPGRFLAAVHPFQGGSL